MTRIAKTLAIVFCAGLLVVVGEMIGPRTAHAVADTLVRVVNTTTEPVPTLDVNKSVTHNVNLFCTSGTGLCVFLPTSGIVDIKSWKVPSGMNFVVTDIELVTYGTGSTTSTFFQLKWTPPGGDLIEEGWQTLNNGATVEFQFQNGPIILAGSTVEGIFGTSLNFAAVRGYLTPN